MDDTGQMSDDLPELSALSTADIPEAVREEKPPSHQTATKRNPLFWGVAALGFVALVAVPLILALRPSPDLAAKSENTVETSAEKPKAASTAPGTAANAPSNAPSNASAPESSASTATADSGNSAALLGHLPYSEASRQQLEAVEPGSGVLLEKTAASKFREMAAAARADGVRLSPLSGFRSVEEQNSLFFDVKAERGEAVMHRAAVSAPPGYSEHHTGYAIDIGDGDYPSTDLELDFEDTRAFKWLQKNAAFYSFEMSFPKNNAQGVSYEPWHWRFIGDRKSLETFYRARQETTNPNSQP